MAYLNFNGKIIKADTEIIGADNRGFRYGDGLFETMKMENGSIRLADLHFERLFGGMQLLEFDPPAYFTREYFSAQIQELAKKNDHQNWVRVRLVIFRGNGGLYDPQNHFPNFIVQTWDLPAPKSELSENGLVLDVYPDARLLFDTFSHLKSNNYLPYVMAALYAKRMQLNDCFLLNTNDHICDATIANVFIVRNNELITPPLTEGCVAGVMRRYLLEKLPLHGFAVSEKPLVIMDLLDAEEIFLTNAIQGIRWVRQVRERQYGHVTTSKIFAAILRNT